MISEKDIEDWMHTGVNIIKEVKENEDKTFAAKDSHSFHYLEEALKLFMISYNESKQT